MSDIEAAGSSSHGVPQGTVTYEEMERLYIGERKKRRKEKQRRKRAESDLRVLHQMLNKLQDDHNGVLHKHKHFQRKFFEIKGRMDEIDRDLREEKFDHKLTYSQKDMVEEDLIQHGKQIKDLTEETTELKKKVKKLEEDIQIQGDREERHVKIQQSQERQLLYYDEHVKDLESELQEKDCGEKYLRGIIKSLDYQLNLERKKSANLQQMLRQQRKSAIDDSYRVSQLDMDRLKSNHAIRKQERKQREFAMDQPLAHLAAKIPTREHLE